MITYEDMRICIHRRISRIRKVFFAETVFFVSRHQSWCSQNYLLCFSLLFINSPQWFFFCIFNLSALMNDLKDSIYNGCMMTKLWWTVTVCSAKQVDWSIRYIFSLFLMNRSSKKGYIYPKCRRDIQCPDASGYQSLAGLSQHADNCGVRRTSYMTLIKSICYIHKLYENKAKK